jgi:hypothetical protein
MLSFFIYSFIAQVETSWRNASLCKNPDGEENYHPNRSKRNDCTVEAGNSGKFGFCGVSKTFSTKKEFLQINSELYSMENQWKMIKHWNRTTSNQNLLSI